VHKSITMQENTSVTEFTPLSHVDEASRVAFYKKTYLHVAFAVALFIIVEYLFLQTPFIVDLAMSMLEGWRWLVLLGLFALATNMAERTALNSHNSSVQYLAMLGFVIAEAFIFIPLIMMALYVSETSGSDVLSQAAIMTLALFTGLSMVALITRKDFSFLRTGLTVGFFIALGLIIAGTLFGFHLGLWFSVAMVALAAGSILYQTSNLIHRYTEDQYVGAALGLFASLMLLFWYILSIFSRD